MAQEKLSIIQLTLLVFVLNEAAALSNGRHADQCVTCINFSLNYGYQLEQITSHEDCDNTSCEGICHELLNGTGQEAYKECGVLCSLAGCRKFINASNTSWKNWFVFCELITACPIMDTGDAKIQSVKVQPPVVPHGSHFKIIVTFLSHNGTGTGEATLLIFNKNSPYPVENVIIMEPLPPGTHQVIWEYTAALDPNCPEKCEYWWPGEYDMQISLCNGLCYGDAPHNKQYDYKEQSFQVINGTFYKP